jgi:hypothetical protein
MKQKTKGKEPAKLKKEIKLIGWQRRFQRLGELGGRLIVMQAV